jgi:hypothetical protein
MLMQKTMRAMMILKMMLISKSKKHDEGDSSNRDESEESSVENDGAAKEEKASKSNNKYKFHPSSDDPLSNVDNQKDFHHSTDPLSNVYDKDKGKNLNGKFDSVDPGKSGFMADGAGVSAATFAVLPGSSSASSKFCYCRSLKSIGNGSNGC